MTVTVLLFASYADALGKSSMELEVVETEPTMSTATKTAMTKPAKLSNGVTVQVPAFINTGERVRVDPSEGKYIERAK